MPYPKRDRRNLNPTRECTACPPWFVECAHFEGQIVALFRRADSQNQHTCERRTQPRREGTVCVARFPMPFSVCSSCPKGQTKTAFCLSIRDFDDETLARAEFQYQQVQMVEAVTA